MVAHEFLEAHYLKTMCALCRLRPVVPRFNHRYSQEIKHSNVVIITDNLP